jgi:hypothetical protein
MSVFSQQMCFQAKSLQCDMRLADTFFVQQNLATLPGGTDYTA